MTEQPPSTPLPADQKPPKFRHTLWWYFKWTFYTVALVLFCVAVAAGSIGLSLYRELERVVPDPKLIATRTKAEATRIYAADGKTLLAVIQGEERKRPNCHLPSATVPKPSTS